MRSLDRRTAPRVRPEPAGYHAQAILRPGHSVDVLNLARGGALVQCGSRLRPGAPTVLQVYRGRARLSLRGIISRCRVSQIAPLVYEAALQFDAQMDLPDEC